MPDTPAVPDGTGEFGRPPRYVEGERGHRRATTGPRDLARALGGSSIVAHEKPSPDEHPVGS